MLNNIHNLEITPKARHMIVPLKLTDAWPNTRTNFLASGHMDGQMNGLTLVTSELRVFMPPLHRLHTTPLPCVGSISSHQNVMFWQLSMKQNWPKTSLNVQPDVGDM